MKTREQRCVHRFNLSLPATFYSHKGSKGSPLMESTTRNISSAGAFFVTGQMFERGTELKISLKLPNLWPMESNRYGATVTLTGTVVRNETEGIAIAFKNNFRFSSPSPAATP